MIIRQLGCLWLVGPGAHVWFTDQANDQIGRLDTATGATSMFPIPTAGGGPLGLVRGPDGALWFTERSAGKVGRMVADGSFTEWTLDPGAFPNRIVVGADGAIWFTELRTSELGRIDSAGRLTQIPLAGGPVGLTLGSDGHLYTALFTAGELARLDRYGHVSAEWALPGATGALQVAQSHGNLWVTDPFSDLLFRVHTS